GVPGPLVWRLALRDDQGAVMSRSCGLVGLGPPYQDAGRDLELLIWLRGSYRNIGIGRLCLPVILRQIVTAFVGLRVNGVPYRLLAYSPDAGVNKADRLAKAQWMNFFFDHGFRSLPPDPEEPAALPGVITLALELNEAAPLLTPGP